METVLIVVHTLIAISLVATVLLQRSEGGALGIGGGGGLISSRGAANLLTRMTTVLAAAFFITSIVLTIIARGGGESVSILDSPETAAGETQEGEGPALGGLPDFDLPSVPDPETAAFPEPE